MSYYLKGKIITPFYIVSENKVLAVVGGELTFDSLLTNNPGQFVFSSGRLSMVSPNNVPLGYDLDNRVTFSSPSGPVNQSFNFENLDNQLKGLYAGVHYSVKSGSLQLHFNNEPSQRVRLVPIQWYTRTMCAPVTGQEVLGHENSFINGLVPPEGATEFSDCRVATYDYCTGTTRCGKCFGPCESGDCIANTNGTQRFRCGTGGNGTSSWTSIHPTVISIIIAIVILVIFFVAAF